MTHPDSERRQVRRLLERGGIGMLVTLDDRGDLAGRPMRPLLLDNDPHIYFLTAGSSEKVTDLEARPQVGLTIATRSCYLSVVGRASVSRDSELIARLWRPTYRAWFPSGKGGGEAVVLRVVVARVDYWEAPRSRFTRLFQAAWATITRRPVETPMKTIDGV